MPRFFNPALLSPAASTTQNLGCIHSSRWQLIPFSSLLKQKQLREVWSWRESISVWRRCPQNAVVQRTCGLHSLLGQRKLPCFALWSIKTSVFHGPVNFGKSCTGRISWVWVQSVQTKLLSLDCLRNCYFSLLFQSTILLYYSLGNLDPKYFFLVLGEKRQDGAECDFSIWAGMGLSRYWVCPCGFSMCQYWLPFPFPSLFAMCSS